MPKHLEVLRYFEQTGSLPSDLLPDDLREIGDALEAIRAPEELQALIRAGHQ